MIKFPVRSTHYARPIRAAMERQLAAQLNESQVELLVTTIIAQRGCTLIDGPSEIEEFRERQLCLVRLGKDLLNAGHSILLQVIEERDFERGNTLVYRVGSHVLDSQLFEEELSYDQGFLPVTLANTLDEIELAVRDALDLQIPSEDD